MNDAMLIVGVMSGTSADGLDIAIVNIEPEGKIHLRHYEEHPMDAEIKESIIRLAQPSLNEIDHLGSLDRKLGEMIAKAVLDTLYNAGIAPSRIHAIASHGQTIRHRPTGSHAFSLQIGCPSTIAHNTGITTVADFRKRDISAGGQGAPLTPFAHKHLFAQEKDTVILNIGGISNMTWLPTKGDVIGFDCGPGNMIMDGLMLELSDGRDGMDKDGALARIGKVQPTLLEELMQNPYFARRPPKSTGREQFGEKVINRLLSEPEISDADRLATACALTVQSIADAMQFLEKDPQQCLICGGGAFNPFLMQSLQAALPQMSVGSTQQAGIAPEAIEAVSFALFAWLSLQGKNNTYAAVTGAEQDVVGGIIAPGENWQSLLKNISK
ncbi:MAG: anhydro-N-acetylmuramic acid kinase [Mariprofundaceae bacterium]|nr:anhydro-N-acetylmuramic acid kinase [Mariprofundaceae bacterium]